MTGNLTKLTVTVLEKHTCKIVKAVMLEDLVQDSKELPHLGGDGLTRETKGQRQDLFIELYRGQKCFTFTYINIQIQNLQSKYTFD